MTLKETLMNARECYDAGRLQEAITALNDDVKRRPGDTTVRSFLCEMLCFAGNLERADLQLDVIAEQDAQAALGVTLFRQLIRAEQARRQFYVDGRLPEFLAPPTDGLKQQLEASIHLREGDVAGAARLLGEAEEQRLKLSGTCDGRAFDDLRDIDDLTSSFFEVLTSNGKYYWIPMDRVELVEFRSPARPLDLLWRRAHMVVQGGPDGEVYLPTLYAGTHAEIDDRMRLGRLTDWRDVAGGLTRGLGQRTFLIGDEARTILEIESISFQLPAA